MNKSYVLKVTKPCNIEVKNEKESFILEVKKGLEVYRSKRYAKMFLEDYKKHGGDGYILEDHERSYKEKYNNSPYTRKKIESILED